MVKLGIGNSRMKDFRDIAYLIKESEFDGELIQKAIKATFTKHWKDGGQWLDELLRTQN